MRTLGQLLGSAARTEVLRVLCYQPGAVGLRQAARIAGVHPHSAELALRELVREGLVSKKPATGGPRYSMAMTHADTPVLAAVFAAAARAAIRQRTDSLHRRGCAILPFIEEAGRMLKSAQSSSNQNRNNHGLH